MEFQKLITQVNEIDKDLSNVNSVFERFQKFKASVKSASDDIGKNKKDKDVIARLRNLYVELAGKQIGWGDDPPFKETRHGGNTKENKEKAKTTTKSSDRILKDISENICATYNQKVTVKLERITSCQKLETQPLSKKAPVIVKKEKTDAAVVIKQENFETLPPKKKVIKKGAIPKKKQPARTKKRNTSRDLMRESDVILQVPETVTVDLVEETDVPKSKRIRSPSTDSLQTLESPEAIRVKTNSRKITASYSESDVYHTPKLEFDSNNTERNSKINLNNNMDKDKPVVRLVPLRMSVCNKYREKMICENMDTDDEVQKKVEDLLPTNIASVMTDDESMDEKIKDEEKENQISPVKKRVEAFERLVSKVIIDTSVQRVTRTKTRNLAKTKLEDTQAQTPVKADWNKEVFTPILDGFMPTSVSTTKINRKMPALAFPSKMLSAIKASQKEFRELEERRRKREADMAKKREEIVQSTKKAKHLRQLEKERMLQLKQKEDAEKKKILAKQRSEERRREEELRRAEEDRLKILQKKEEERLELKKKTAKKTGVQKNLAVYMVEKAPLLPSYDCYDSDDPAAKTSNAALQRPDWIKDVSMHSSMKTMSFIEDKLKNTLYCPTPQTPDLEEIFENIDPKKLRRNSSANWSYQPRFTRMPQVQEDF